MDKPRLEKTGRGLTVFDNRYLYSKKDPRRSPSMLAEKILPEERCLYLLPSPLLGYGIEQLLDKLPESSYILAFEVSQALFKLCSPHISDQLLKSPQLSVVRLSENESMQKMLDELGPWKFRKTIRINLNAGTQNKQILYDSLCEFAAEYQINYWRNRHALRLLGRNWIKHTYANLLHFSESTTLESDERPILVIGAGPSLESVLDFLKKHREGLNIWASDTALGTLLTAGIDPDLVCVLETQAWNHLDFHGNSGRGIPILADLSSYPNTISTADGPCVFYSSCFTELEFLDRLYRFHNKLIKIPALGSVGLAAVQLALDNSRGLIFLAGLDFSYTPGKTHARGSTWHRWQLVSMSRINPLPGWYACMQRGPLNFKGMDGSQLRSDRVLQGYADLFRSRFGGIKRLYQIAGPLDLGVARLSLSEAEKMLHSASGQSHTSNTHSGSAQSDAISRQSNNTLRGKDFLLSEKNLLEELIHAWDAYAEGESDAESVCERLKGLDHIYCDFPDLPPLPKADDVFLVRAVKRGRELHRCVSRLLEND